MEPGPRRRRRSRPLVAAFLRDPGSGRVYRRGKLIGKGAFSRCYKLTDMSTSAVFALKVVPRAGGPAGRLRPRAKVEREIALHSRLRHRNIVAFHGHFADREHIYMVLEYCSRQSLAHVLKARQTLTEPEVRYYLRGLVSGLRYLHRRRIVHRDLKLSNFFLNKNMEVKIGDLGLAARMGPGGRCHKVLCGTPNFQAPEVVSRNGHSCQSDVWALGCIMYTVLTGTPPFGAAPLSEMYQNIRNARYPEPEHLSSPARSLIARLLAPDPAERPSLDHVLQDDFFTQGFTPDRLPPHSCHSPPIFAIPQPLGRLFRRVGQLLLTQCRPPCPFTPKETSGPEQDSELDSTEGCKSEESPGPEVKAAIQGLQLCLDAGPTVMQDVPGEQPPLLWAPTWVDYSSKYGFGYHLSDGGSGVLLRDGTHMALRPPRSQVCYAPARGKLETFELRAVPSALGAKLAVLRLFTRYLQQQLRKEGALPRPTPTAGPSLCLLRVLVSDQASVLLFSDGTVQSAAHCALQPGLQPGERGVTQERERRPEAAPSVDAIAGLPEGYRLGLSSPQAADSEHLSGEEEKVGCSGEQARLVLSGEGENRLLTLWEPGHPTASYPLGMLRSQGCAPATRQRLLLALRTLQSI
ncbi:inactive serine/threonine-protein kinase PLK5 [Rhynchocyon petersi]